MTKSLYEMLPIDVPGQWKVVNSAGIAVFFGSRHECLEWSNRGRHEMITPTVGQIWDTRSGARVAIVEEYKTTHGVHPLFKLAVLAAGETALTPGSAVAIYATGLQSNVPGAPLPLDLVKMVGAFNAN